MDIDWNRVMQEKLSSSIKDLFCYIVLFFGIDRFLNFALLLT